MNKKKRKKIELAFPKYEEENDEYQIESIELSISGLIETSEITKLAVSAKGEGELRVILKPKSQA